MNSTFKQSYTFVQGELYAIVNVMGEGYLRTLVLI